MSMLGFVTLAFVFAWLGTHLRPRPPAYWSKKPWNPFTDDFEAEVDVTAELQETLQQLMDMTTKRDAMGVGKDGKWATHKAFKVIKVTRIENGRLWTKYAQYRSLMQPLNVLLD